MTSASGKISENHEPSRGGNCRKIVVGVGDVAASGHVGDLFRTYALGSCVGVVAIDRESHITGILHFVLPESDGSARAPAYFADTGVATLVDAMIAAGAANPGAAWRVKIAGGEKMLNNCDGGGLPGHWASKLNGVQAVPLAKRYGRYCRRCGWRARPQSRRCRRQFRRERHEPVSPGRDLVSGCPW